MSLYCEAFKKLRSDLRGSTEPWCSQWEFPSWRLVLLLFPHSPPTEDLCPCEKNGAHITTHQGSFFWNTSDQKCFRFGTFEMLEYSDMHNELIILGLGHKIHLCLIYTLFTRPESGLTQYFSCTCILIVTSPWSEGMEFSTYGMLDTKHFRFWSILDFRFSD
jgi:hypothetical protein